MKRVQLGSVFATVVLWSVAFCAWAQSGAGAVSFYSIALGNATSTSGVWSVVDSALAAVNAGQPDEGVALLGALVRGAGVVPQPVRETAELEVLQAIVLHRPSGPWPPPVVLTMYADLPETRDPALRAAVLRALAGVRLPSVKPLVLEGARLVRGLARVPASRGANGGPRFGYDATLEQEAAAWVDACRGKVDNALADELSAIAEYSRDGSTITAARALARSWFKAKK